MWIQPLCYLLGGVALTSVFSASSYFFGQWFRRVKPQTATLIDYTLAILSALVFHLFILVVVLPLGLCAASAKRASEGKSKSLLSHFAQIFSSTALFPFVLYVVWISIGFSSPSTLANFHSFVRAWLFTVPQYTGEAFFVGLYLGLVATPSVIPIFIWMWRSSKLRPGIDRHFSTEENFQS